MATLTRGVHGIRLHPGGALAATAAAGTAVYLTLHQEVLMHLNLLLGP